MYLIQKRIHKQAIKSGWWDKPRSPLEIHALIHSEISEATEEARKGTPPIYKSTEIHTRDSVDEHIITPDAPEWDSDYWKTEKPEGEAVELADALIRILDYAEYKGWDMKEIIDRKLNYNATRPYRHGGKRY